MDALASPWSPNGGRVVVTVIDQSTLLEAQRRHRRVRNVAHIEGLSFAVERMCTWRSLADHYASILQPRQCSCVPSASFERPLSDQPPRRPFCDCFEHVQNLMATMASMAILNVLCTTFERPRQPCCLVWASNGDLVSFMVARGRHKGRRLCVKGVLDRARARGFDFGHDQDSNPGQRLRNLANL